MKGRILPVRATGHVDGHCYFARLPGAIPAGDDMVDSMRSCVRVFEDGVEIGPPHSLHDEITANGGGRFSHWGRDLYLSSSDNSDPRTNGRLYQIVYWSEKNPRADLFATCQSLDFDTMTPELRHTWAERLFNALEPEIRLSETNRWLFADREFLADFERFETQNYRSFDRKYALRELIKLALPLAGDFAECGVWRGASAYLMAKELARHGADKHLYLFDSFDGVSDPNPDLDGSFWQRGYLSASLQEVQANCWQYASFFTCLQGWIPERFGDIAECQFSFVHIDVDLYEPTRDSLEFFGARMVSGGVIVCDDYGFATCPGARKAVDDFAAAQHMPVVHLPTGQGVLFFGQAEV